MPETMNMSPHAMQLLRNAQAEAEGLHAPTIEAEHLLLALIDDEGSIAFAVFRDDLKIDAHEVKRVVELVSKNFVSASADEGIKPLSSVRMFHIMAVAFDEAKRAGRSEIDVEHLLLGVAGTDDRFMREVFKRLNLKPEQIRQKVHDRLPEIPLQPVRRGNWRARFKEEFRHNIAYYFPQPIRKLFGRWIDPSQPPPLG